MIRESIASAFTTAGLNVKPIYSYPNAVEDGEIALEKNDVLRHLMLVDNQPESNELMRDSRGLIEAGRLMLFVIARRPKLAVTSMESWLSELYVSDLGGVNAKPNAPFDYNGVTFWKFRPFEPLNKMADKYGTRYWIVDQLIDFAATTT